MEKEKSPEKGKSIYSTDDFPVIYAPPDLSTECNIDWANPTVEETELMSFIKGGISLTKKQFEEFEKDFRDLNKRYDVHEPFATLEYIENDNDEYSVGLVVLDGGKGTYMHIFRAEKYHRGAPIDGMVTYENKIGLHNVDHPWEALFFTECLAEYFQYAGVTFPYIRSEIEKTEMIEHPVRWDDERARKVKIHIRNYSFEIPCLEGFKYDVWVQRDPILKILENCVFEEESVFLVKNNEKRRVAFKKQNDLGEAVWVVEKEKSALLAIGLFRLFGNALKRQSWLNE